MSFLKTTLLATSLLISHTVAEVAKIDYYKPFPFGKDTASAVKADLAATGQWWDNKKIDLRQKEWLVNQPREKTLAFAVYAAHEGILKITAQCFPLKPDEPKSVTLYLEKNGTWEKASEAPLHYPGWDAHFRLEGWDSSKDVKYKLSLGELSHFEGLIRKDPTDKDNIIVASMSCNSPRDKQMFTRSKLVTNLKKHNPDLLFFAGDQNYTHEAATYGWLQFGIQFRDVLRDRPSICIPDDHDIGHANLWGEGGKKSSRKGGTDGGYMFPPSFVNMVQRQQSGHLPDPYDPTPVKQGIGVYYTDFTLGHISFAILEDRKFKSAPARLPKTKGKRQDHISDKNYDRSSVDLPGLKLLGDRQLTFLQNWGGDWKNAKLKVALSQTVFCGAVHRHGSQKTKLLADLDCNGWPQTGRNNALRLLRQAQASHLCGDQHLGVVVKHGIESHRDGPMTSSSPALVNSVYGRWWWPDNEQAGSGEAITSTLPWVGDYNDGFGNKMTMYAYANPGLKTSGDIRSGKEHPNRGDGYAIAKFNTSTGQTTFECWPRNADVSQGDKGQYTGWPITFNANENDGRKVLGHLPETKLPFKNAVVELTDSLTKERIYCIRVQGETFQAPYYKESQYTLKAGKDKADTVIYQTSEKK